MIYQSHDTADTGNGTQPLFLYMAPADAHSPLQARDGPTHTVRLRRLRGSGGEPEFVCPPARTARRTPARAHGWCRWVGQNDGKPRRIITTAVAFFSFARFARFVEQAPQEFLDLYPQDWYLDRRQHVPRAVHFQDGGGNIRFRLPICTYAPWGVRVDGKAKSQHTTQPMCLPLTQVRGHVLLLGCLGGKHHARPAR